MRIDLTDLRVFLHACAARSMTAAAQRSHLTLAAVSARIRALEDGTGVLLLQRHARGVSVTPAGEALARHARVVLHQLALLQRDLAPAREAGAGKVVVLANSAALARPWAGILQEAWATAPGGEFSVRESASEVTVHALRSGAADLGIVSDAAAAEGLEVEDLGPDPLVAVAPLAHPLAKRGPGRFEDLLPHDWVAWGEGSALHTHLAMQASRLGRTIRVRASIGSPRDLLALVAAGAGVSVVPAALVDQAAPARQLAVVPLEEAWARRRLLLCACPGVVHPAALALARCIRARWWPAPLAGPA